MEVKSSKKQAKRLNPQVREGQAEADALFLSIGDGAIVTDGAGRVSRINQAALQILGFKKRELIGKWYPDVVIAEDKNGHVLSNYDRPITQVFISGETISTRIYYRRKDGSRVPVSLNVAPVLMHNKPIGAIEVFRDITQELALEQAKDDFISIASHQLRTPATGVKQYTGMLLEGYAEKLTPKQHSLLSRAYDSNERQLGIIENLLNVARLDAGNITLQIENIDLVKILKDVVREQSSKIKARHQDISFIHPQRSVMVEGDNSRLRMVIENLLDNAIKYTPEGKKISLKAYQLKDISVINVRDQGVGVAAEDIDKLFQKFQRIPNELTVEAGGTGLGLYWAEKIVKLHGGRIYITSTVGKGSCFSLHLPNTYDENHTEE